MNIAISEQPSAQCWVVRIDALQLNFNSLEQAQAFVNQLKARLDAPHAWPVSASPAGFSRRLPERRLVRPHGERARNSLVKS